MTRSAVLLALLLVASCKKPVSDAPRSEPSSAPSVAQGTTSAEAPPTRSGPVLTPEDAEAETERHITEQNLESELDRLEREIQAE